MTQAAEQKTLSQAELSELWTKLGDISVNNEDETIDEPFHIWEAGTPREEVWHWFDQQFEHGLYKHIFGEES